MKLGIGLGYSPRKLKIPMEDILFAEKMGFDSVWAAESYGSDSVSVASYVLAQTSKIKVGTAIMQMQARTPTMTAMTAMSLNALSDIDFCWVWVLLDLKWLKDGMGRHLVVL